MPPPLTTPAPVLVTLPPFDLSRALARLKGRRAAVVYMHDNPDPDSIAAAMGLKRVLEQEVGLTATLAFGGIVGRAENRAMVEALQVPLVPIEMIRADQFDTVAIVDTQPGTGNNSVPRDCPVDIIVDHHPPRSDAAIRAEWCDIRPHLGATSTIILEYLRQRAVPLDAGLATALFYALRTETRDLGRESTNAERDAYLHLVQLVDHNLLYRISHPKVPRGHFVALDKALRSARVYGDVLAANLDELSYPDLVAEVADLLLAYEGAKFVMCGGRFKGRAYVSLRTDPGYRRAGSLMRQVIGSLGAAGGHGTMAGGSLAAPVTGAEGLETTFMGLVAGLHAALGRPLPQPTSLIEGR